jgi:hypothetical protein
MSLAEKLIKDFETLPDDQKREVIDFVEFLKEKSQRELGKLMNIVIAENEVVLKELSK